LTDRAKVLYSGLVMDGTRIREPYVPPLVSDYGTLLEMTADGGALMHVGMSSGGFVMAATSVPLTPPGGPPETPPVTPPVTPPTGETVVLGQGGGGGEGFDGGGEGGGGGGDTLGGGGGSGGGDGGGGGGAAGGGDLPFTGFAAAAVGAIGAGMSAAGLAIRSRLRRRP
jgi:hypothetical protein